MPQSILSFKWKGSIISKDAQFVTINGQWVLLVKSVFKGNIVLIYLLVSEILGRGECWLLGEKSVKFKKVKNKKIQLESL